MSNKKHLLQLTVILVLTLGYSWTNGIEKPPNNPIVGVWLAKEAGVDEDFTEIQFYDDNSFMIYIQGFELIGNPIVIGKYSIDYNTEPVQIKLFDMFGPDPGPVNTGYFGTVIFSKDQEEMTMELFVEGTEDPDIPDLTWELQKKY